MRVTIANGVADEIDDWSRTIDNDGPRGESVRAAFFNRSKTTTGFDGSGQTETDFLALLDFIGDPHGAQSCNPSTKAAARRYHTMWKPR